MKNRNTFVVIIVLFVYILTCNVLASGTFKAKDILLKNDGDNDAITVEQAINNLYKNLSMNVLMIGGNPISEFSISKDNNNATVTDKGHYQYLWSGGSGLNAFYYTYVDLSGYKTLHYVASINQSNTTAGALFISTSNSTYRKDDPNVIKSSLLSTNLGEYTVDISDLDGYYYVGFIGSNRYVSIYNLWLE